MPHAFSTTPFRVRDEEGFQTWVGTLSLPDGGTLAVTRDEAGISLAAPSQHPIDRALLPQEVAEHGFEGDLSALERELDFKAELADHLAPGQQVTLTEVGFERGGHDPYGVVTVFLCGEGGVEVRDMSLQDWADRESGDQ